jgi:hypothetical protein
MVNESLKLVPNNENFYEFIRILRNDEENQKGFLEKVNISLDQQIKYMEKFKNSYFICLQNEIPIGYVGVIENDIRVCTDTKYKKSGAGTFMINEITKIYPNSTAKILKNNQASLNLFKKCGFEIYSSDENLFYLIQKKK